MRLPAFVATLLAAIVLPASAQTETDSSRPQNNFARLGGPTSVAEELAEDRIDAERSGLNRWNAWKQSIEDRYGLTFSFEYNSLVQGYGNSAADVWASSGNARLFGNWTLLNKDTDNHGSLVFRVDNRHRYTAQAPQGAGLAAGSGNLTGALFSDREWGLVNLQWSQALFDGKGGLVFGWTPADDYFHAYGLANPLTAFNNLAFSIGAEFALPDSGIGVAGGTMLGENFYWKGGVHDANGNAAEPNLDVFGDWELYKNLELGWTSGQEKLYLDNFHVGFWHADERVEAGVPEDWGFVGNASWYFEESRLLPFLRGGWANGEAALLDKQVSAGIGKQMRERDLAGIGVSWGSPSGDGLRDQWTTELFYRIQIKNFAITPSVQMIVDPALNPAEDVMWVGGLRGRLVF